jgi:tetratricopeptide (TPR) repeat protein
MLALAMRLVARYPAESDAYAVLAQAYYRLERFDDVLEAAGRGIRLYPGNLDAWLCVSGASLHKRQWGGALFAALVAFDISPGEPALYELAADAHEGMGENELAAQARSLADEVRSIPRPMWRIIDSGSWKIQRRWDFRFKSRELLDSYQ